jgi:hypothetical protein
VTLVGEKRDAFTFFMGKLQGNKPLERPRYRWADNVQINFKR